MDLVVEKNLRVAMRDGVELATDVYRPATGGPFPTLLERIPYNKESYGMISGWVDVLRAAREGFAVVVQDTRGRYQSDGTFRPFADERTDGADTIAWAAGQAWSTGSVGMFGSSYTGATQWLAAAERPPALATISAAVTSRDYYDSWLYQGGAFRLGFALQWVTSALGLGELLRNPSVEENRIADLRRMLDNMDDVFRTLPARDHPTLTAIAPYLAQWLDHPDRDDYWERLSAAVPDVPVLNIGGWHDLFLGGTIDNYLALRARSDRPDARRQRLIIGPWAHGATSGVFPERSFGVQAGADATDITGVQLAWFKEHLAGSPSTVSPSPVRIFVMGPDIWRDEPDWPLPDTEYVDYFLGSTTDARTSAGDGTLSTSTGSAAASDSFVYDPDDPVTTCGGATFLPGLFIGANAGPRDQTRTEARQDVLCYTSAPLDRSLEVTGPVRAKLYVSSSVVDTDFTATLVDVHPDGRAELVCDGILRCRYRTSTTRPVFLEPGAVYEIDIDLVATAYVFGPGHRLRLDVSSSNFPKYDRNPNSAIPVADARREDLVVATNTVWHDDTRLSRLVLPVVRRSA
ncbi:CocE/NonD family hydrolase [Nocardia fusca]|uniref:CocE/NonD family hydrolase n=1 Tax=Nocardia fusca TaxID=941183 RepID=UPI0037A1162C